MNLNDVQKQQVAAWLQQGAKLAEIQKRIETEFKLVLTYMEVKLLVSDLQVLPIDPAPPTPPAAPQAATAAANPAATDRAAPLGEALPAGPPASPFPGGSVAINVDQLARPGAMVSGSVTFSDGKGAMWYIDQMGRLGLAPKEKGYRPSAADMQQFQAHLEQELSRQGF